MAKPNITCPKCRGKGCVEMTDELHEALRSVSKSGNTAEQVSASLNWKGHITAINNRLEDLRAMGFLTRVRDGRNWIYTKASHD